MTARRETADPEEAGRSSTRQGALNSSDDTSNGRQRAFVTELLRPLLELRGAA